jgi:hypothetical protein
MYRDIGNQSQIKGTPPSSSSDERRKIQDQKVFEDVVVNLSKDCLSFNERNFRVFCQPYFDKETKYLESLKDTVSFIISISSQNKHLSGGTILSNLNVILSIIQKEEYKDLDNQSISLDTILKKNYLSNY